MSYLTLTKGIPDFSKAVISLWFRAPRELVIAAAASAIGDNPDFPLLQSILPVITFGAPQQSKLYSTPTRNVAEIQPSPVPDEPSPSTTYNTLYYVEGLSYDVDPSYIGLVCNPGGTFNMAFNLQTKDLMALSATGFITTKMKIWSGTDPEAPTDTSPGGGAVGLFPNVGVATIEDASYVDNAQPEFFTVLTDNYLQPDQWHHLLLSFDISGSVSIGHPFASSACRLWYAIDDVDYRGPVNLRPYRDSEGTFGPDTLGPNAILTRNAWRLSGVDASDPDTTLYQNQAIALPSGNLSGGSIPSGDAPMGIPASPKYVEGIFRCEMAELQMWTGVTLDTGVTAHRRVFVDVDGFPVDPEGSEDDPAPAVMLLGKKPEVLLHGSSDWSVGYNTGTLGIEENSEGDIVKIASGQFVPTAKIEPYKPDPSLEETTA